MSADPFYKSINWKMLREAVIKRSGGRCEVSGCTSPGKTVDHIISRRRGGPDALSNLRHLCARHDNEVKEDQHGNRRGGATFKPNSACDASGLPVDRDHQFYSGGEGRSNIPTQRAPEPAQGRIRSKFERGG
jgi:hypothetical protein